jgi:hypothetical protein
MTTYNTQNPIGSTDPRDMYDNAQNFDECVNSTAFTFDDRFGNARKTIAGAVAAIGYDLTLGNYGAGKTFTDRNQVILYSGEYYKAKASAALPFTTTGTWGTDSASLVGVGDAVLRQDLLENDGASKVGYLPIGTGAVSTTVQQQLRNIQAQEIYVTDAPFYAVGNIPTGDDTAAIQAAVDYAHSLNMPTRVVVPSGKTFYLSANTRAGIADGVAGLVMRDNVVLVINGTLKAKDDLYGPGTLSALIKSPDVGNTNIAIIGSGVVDGNRDNQLTSPQCDNIYLRAVYNVVVQGIHCANANGNGILIDKAVGGANHINTLITNTTVNGCNSIGIQVSHSAANLIIADNRVTSCVNNCIDVYNENGTTAPDPGLISICGNTVANGLVGIFPETTQNCSVVGNTIGGCSYAGISTNRVNGAPDNIVISGNVIYNCPNGIVGSGDTNGVLITGNTIKSFSAAGILLAGPTVSRYTVHGNTFNPSATTVPIIKLEGTSLVWNQVFNNVCYDVSHDRSFGLVRIGGGNGNTLEPIIYSVDVRPVKTSGLGATTSGGALVIQAPAYASGKLVISANSGGAWESVWSGSFVTGSGRVSVVQESTTFTAPGNAIASVAGSASTLDITVTWTATGAGGGYNYWLEYIG